MLSSIPKIIFDNVQLSSQRELHSLAVVYYNSVGRLPYARIQDNLFGVCVHSDGKLYIAERTSAVRRSVGGVVTVVHD